MANQIGAYALDGLNSIGVFEFDQLAFPGNIAGDGGHMWPPRANDPRWTQLLLDSGITQTGDFIDDVHTALEALAQTTGQMDDLWAKTKALYNVTDTSEPFLY
jgi:hypothetical protein